MVLKNCKKIGPYQCFCDYVLWGLSYSHAWKKTHNCSPSWPVNGSTQFCSSVCAPSIILYHIILSKNKQNLFITNHLLFEWHAASHFPLFPPTFYFPIIFLIKQKKNIFLVYS